MKTLLVTLEFPPLIGGVETYYGKLVEYWPEEIRVLDNSERKLVRGSWLIGLLSVARRLRSYRPDWLLVGEILPIGTMAWLLSFLFPFKYAVFLHGLDFSLAVSSARKRFLARRILAGASRIIAVNSYTANQVRTTFPFLNNITVANPGVEPATEVPVSAIAGLRQNYGLQDAFVIATVARFVKRKGVDMVMRALPEVRREIPEIRYVVIGQGPAEGYLKGLSVSLGIAEQVLMLSGLDTRTKDAWLAACDAFVMPVRDIAGDYEGFGIVYLEANSFAKPVIAGLSGGVGDAVVDGVNGLRVDENDPSAIAAAIIRLYREQSLREQLGRQGCERARLFAWKLQVQKIFAILTSQTV